MTESRQITREYFEILGVKKGQLLEKAQLAPTRAEFLDVFDHIIRINRLQMGLIPQIYPRRKDA